ncbi:MAG: type IV pilin protein [Candidatus Muiribacteriota bacterium]
MINLKKRGITLVELMIVMAILSILVVVGMPYYTSYIEDTKRAKTEMIIDSLKTTVELYKMDAANRRKFVDRMNLDNTVGGNTEEFSLQDLEKFGYLQDPDLLETAWGEPFSIIRKEREEDVFSVFLIYNVHYGDSAETREVFLASQGY